MIVKRNEFGFEKVSEAFADDMELIVSVANLAGYMESSKQICVEDDASLTRFCICFVEHYLRTDSPEKSFEELAVDELIKKYPMD